LCGPPEPEGHEARRVKERQRQNERRKKKRKRVYEQRAAEKVQRRLLPRTTTTTPLSTSCNTAAAHTRSSSTTPATSLEVGVCHTHVQVCRLCFILFSKPSHVPHQWFNQTRPHTHTHTHTHILNHSWPSSRRLIAKPICRRNWTSVMTVLGHRICPHAAPRQLPRH
jgi:hypothetical protein